MTDMKKIIDPPHYEIIPPGTYPDGLEYMDIMEYVLGNRTDNFNVTPLEGHLLGQIFKYAFRFGKKDKIEQEAKKIEWYAKRLVKVIEKRSEKDTTYD